MKGILLSMLAVAAPVLASEPTGDSRISVAYKGQRGGKPPLRFYSFELSVENPHEFPVWYILRASGETPLPEAAGFKSLADSDRGNFVCHAYDGGKNGGTGVFVELRFLGTPGFVAFLLPARGSLRADALQVEAWAEFNELEVWEARDILVNGATPLRDWLPYQAESSAQVHIPAGTDWFTKHSGFAWKSGRSEADLPSEAGLELSVTAFQKTKLPFSTRSP